MIKLWIDEEALGHGIITLDADVEKEGDFRLSEDMEYKTGVQELEVSENKELLFLNHALIGDPEEELDFLIKQAKHFRGRYDLPQLGLENLTLEEVFKAIKEHCLKDFTIPKLTTPTQK